jgi:hypothetical protein
VNIRIAWKGATIFHEDGYPLRVTYGAHNVLHRVHGLACACLDLQLTQKRFTELLCFNQTADKSTVRFFISPVHVVIGFVVYFI